MKSGIALIGFMGVGKSVTGKLLAERLGENFIEVDALIEKKAGKPITRIFADEGEIRFRELEIETIKDILTQPNQVIACGGGVVLNRINIDRLKQRAIIIWLTASPEIIIRRTCMNGDERPILKNIQNLQELKALIRFRKPFYERSADIMISTSRLSVDKTVTKIIEKLKDYADIHS